MNSPHKTPKPDIDKYVRILKLPNSFNPVPISHQENSLKGEQTDKIPIKINQYLNSLKNPVFSQTFHKNNIKIPPLQETSNDFKCLTDRSSKNKPISSIDEQSFSKTNTLNKDLYEK